MNVNDTVQTLLDAYGDGSDGTAPTQDQWRRILERNPENGFGLVNFFKFRETADYGDASTLPKISGNEAFQRYADVSVPTMQKAGGEFLAVAPFAGSLLGPEQDWDLIAIGKYPDLAAFTALYTDAAYIEAFKHRAAAVARQTVMAIET
ncbi:MAG: DUF1330 domain-containing protein [Pseudomonadota bacterium]